MKYMGSKSKIAKYVVPIIQKYIDDNEPWAYIEPFCGGCNIIDKVHAKKRLAYDKQEYLIELFQNLCKLELLQDFVTKEHYDDVRRDFYNGARIYDKWYIAAIGFLASYNGRFFDGGYAGIVQTEYGERNYYDEALRNLKKQIPDLKGIEFNCADYKMLNPRESVIYCDPPYKGTKEYGTSKNFDYGEFWDWVRKVSSNNIVIVSSNDAPEDFRCIWSKPVSRTIRANGKGLGAIEKLFIHEKN